MFPIYLYTQYSTDAFLIDSNHIKISLTRRNNLRIFVTVFLLCPNQAQLCVHVCRELSKNSLLQKYHHKPSVIRDIQNTCQTKWAWQQKDTNQSESPTLKVKANQTAVPSVRISMQDYNNGKPEKAFSWKIYFDMILLIWNTLLILLTKIRDRSSLSYGWDLKCQPCAAPPSCCSPQHSLKTSASEVRCSKAVHARR